MFLYSVLLLVVMDLNPLIFLTPGKQQCVFLIVFSLKNVWFWFGIEMQGPEKMWNKLELGLDANSSNNKQFNFQDSVDMLHSLLSINYLFYLQYGWIPKNLEWSCQVDQFLLTYISSPNAFSKFTKGKARNLFWHAGVWCDWVVDRSVLYCHNFLNLLEKVCHTNDLVLIEV